MKTPALLLTFLLLVQAAQAGPRTSANYTIATDITDAGGQRATSANYTSEGSAGGIAGDPVPTSPNYSVKSGFEGQRFEIIGFVLSANPTTINEGGTLQLSGGQLLDDATTLALPAASVAWSVAGGPLTGINASGLATAGIVYQNTAATAQGIYSGSTSTLALTVVNVNTDDLVGYAGDGIDDAWQVQYFGQPPNANAAPNVDFDHTGQTNLFKYIAGLNPLDPNSRFALTIAQTPDPAHPGQFLAGQKNLIFNPRFAGRTYTVFSKTDLAAGSFVPLANPSAPGDNGPERTITDLSASGTRKFYRIEITKP